MSSYINNKIVYIIIIFYGYKAIRALVQSYFACNIARVYTLISM